MARSVTPAVPKVPKRLHAAAVTSGSVLLYWRALPGARRYGILRDGRRRGSTTAAHFNDTKVKPGETHRYRVRARGRHGWLGPASHAITVKVPRKKQPGGGGSGGSVPTPGASDLPVVGGSPPDDPGPGTPMTQAMVDRLFWRAGFGPTAADRQAWTGKTAAQLVDHFLDTPQQLAATSTPPLTQGGQPIDPLANDDELVMEWLDTMQRAQNPFTERLTFFWHRHFAANRQDGIPAEWMVTYRDLLRGYGDLAAHPDATFRALALDMTTRDGAMSYFLTMCYNQAGQVNENYAREFMELFCLGVVDAQGNPNYTQGDVGQLARAFTGWRLDQQPANATYGQVSFGGPSYFDSGSKTIFGQTGNFGAAEGVDLVLARPSHAPFLVRKLWGEFISQPIPQATLDALVATYTAGGQLKLKPLLKGILNDPLMFASIDEPDMIKPPIVLTVGVLKALDVGMRWFWIPDVMTDMQQRPYNPPNVSGWEGGLSWLNTNTAQARFELVLRALYLKHRGYANVITPPADVPGETAQQAYDRAYVAVGSPWLSAGTASLLQTMAAGMAAGTAAQRAQRQYALRAYILAGPDAQVM
ncbi:MAG: hypothetical protein QOG68_2641 [Solirubrobacteraceae bacterium]|nr:hypothetical protein [Solirubrobacteraceae bacterium]